MYAVVGPAYHVKGCVCVCACVCPGVGAATDPRAVLCGNAFTVSVVRGTLISVP